MQFLSFGMSALSVPADGGAAAAGVNQFFLHPTACSQASDSLHPIHNQLSVLMFLLCLHDGPNRQLLRFKQPALCLCHSKLRHAQGLIRSVPVSHWDEVVDQPYGVLYS